MYKTTLRPEGRHAPLQRLSGIGIAFAILGLIAMILPAIATTTLVTLLAAAMVFWGGLGALMSYKSAILDTRIVTLAFALVAVVGLLFLVFPGLGAEVLTLMVVASLLLEGIYSILSSLSLKVGHAGWIWMFASGAVALIVGFLILLGWPDTASWLLGLGLGFNFLTTGVALILLGRARQSKQRTRLQFGRRGQN